MQNIIIVQRSSSMYLAEAIVGTGPHALLGTIRIPCLKSPNSSWLLCPTETYWAILWEQELGTIAVK